MLSKQARERAHERWMQHRDPTPYRCWKCGICQKARTGECSVPDENLGRTDENMETNCICFKLLTGRVLSFLNFLLGLCCLTLIGATDKFWASLLFLVMFGCFMWLGYYTNPDIKTYGG